MRISCLLALSTVGSFAIAQEELFDIPTTAANAGTFTALLGALQFGGLTEALSGEGPFTVFAPSDEAFSQLEVDESILFCLLGQPDLIDSLWISHELGHHGY